MSRMSGISNFVNAPSSVGTSPMTGANQLHHQARAGILFVTMRTCFIVRYPFATHIPQPRPRDTLLSYPRVNDVTIAEASELAAFSRSSRPSFRMQIQKTGLQQLLLQRVVNCRYQPTRLICVQGQRSENVLEFHPRNLLSACRLRYHLGMLHITIHLPSFRLWSGGESQDSPFRVFENLL